MNRQHLAGAYDFWKRALLHLLDLNAKVFPMFADAPCRRWVELANDAGLRG